jgi:hypothetical protein
VKEPEQVKFAKVKVKIVVLEVLGERLERPTLTLAQFNAPPPEIAHVVFEPSILFNMIAPETTKV